MGIVSDLLFGQVPKPRVTPEEWKKVRGNLYSHHYFTTKELDKVEGIFRGDMIEQRAEDRGVDTNELVRGIQYMREHIKIHHISLEKINALEEEVMKYIATS
ncbi:MAG: hypothetical protein C0412_17245 [Flavobacterium sp.]|nr:hypothetical protein [Flavobacterium sp.]